MTRTLLHPDRDVLDAELLKVLQPIIWSWLGTTDKGVALTNTTVSDAAKYALDAANAGTDKKALRAVADSHSLTVNGSGITLSSGAVTNDLSVGQDLTVTRHLTVGGNAALGNTATDATTITGSLTQTAGAVALSSPTTITLTTATSLSVGTATGTSLFVAASNNRVQVGSATALSGADNSLCEVIGGRLYVQPANDALGFGMRYGATSGTVYLGVTNSTDPSLTVVDNGGAEVGRFGNNTDTYQLVVTGDAQVTSDLTVGGTLTLSGSLVLPGDLVAARAAIGATTFSGTEELRVVGQSSLEGAVTITSGGLSATGSSVFSSGISVTTGGVTVTAGGVTITGDNLTFGGANQIITGDWTTGTRPYFQTSGTDASTTVGVKPSGTAAESRFVAHNNSNTSTGSRSFFGIDATSAYIVTAGTAIGIQLRPASSVMLDVNGTGVAFNGKTPAARPDYTITNPSTDRAINVTGDTTAQVAAVLGTLIQDLIDIGLLQ